MFKSWPHINLFHNTVKYAHTQDDIETIVYRQKIKLDGTNAAMQILKTGEVIAQSRTQIVTPTNDNYQFAHWVDSKRDFFALLKNDNADYTVFGEWCGLGIQKRCSISNIGRRVFAIYAILVEDSVNPPYYVVDGDKIAAIVPTSDDIKIIDFMPGELAINFSSEESLQHCVNTLNDVVASVENCDPWVKETFGIEGLGEGVVLYPTSRFQEMGMGVVWEKNIRKEFIDCFLFKAKGEKHNVVKLKQPVQINAEKASSVEEFVKLVVTEPRLEQFANGVYDQKNTGNFLKAFTSDVERESNAELEASNLVWKDVSKDVSTAARNWYFTKAKAI